MPAGTGYSMPGGYQQPVSSASLDPTVNDGNTATGPFSSTSPPASCMAVIDLGADANVSQVDMVTGYSNLLTRDLDYSLSASPTVFIPLTLPSAPSHGGTFSLLSDSVTGLSITARYIRYSAQNSFGTISIPELDVTVNSTTIILSEGPPGTDQVSLAFAQIPEGSPGTDGARVAGTLNFTEGAPGSDLIPRAFLDIAPGTDALYSAFPLVEGAPGGDGCVLARAQFAEAAPGVQTVFRDLGVFREGGIGEDAFYTLDLAHLIEGAPGGDAIDAQHLLQEDPPGADGSWPVMVFYELSEPSYDSISSIGMGRLMEDAPGGDGAIPTLLTRALTEDAPPFYDRLIANPSGTSTAVLYEGAPGAPAPDGAAGSPVTVSSCQVRQRSKYCPQADGSFRYPYPVSPVSADNVVGIDPGTYIKFTDPVVHHDGIGTTPFTIPDNSGAHVEALAEAAFSWWRPTTAGYSQRFANSTGNLGDILPDDTTAQLLYGLQEVNLDLKITRRGVQYRGAASIHPDGSGGWFMTKSLDTATNVTEVVEYVWDNFIGSPRTVLIFGGSGSIGGEDTTQCFEVNPAWDNTFSILDWMKIFSYSPGSFSYALSATIYDSITLEWINPHYVYEVQSYECCFKGCDPCTGDVAMIAAGSTVSICVGSTFVPCGQVPPAPTVTGPIPECKVLNVVNCRATIQTPCLTQAQQDKGGYQGPYFVAAPGALSCHKNGQDYCEMFLGVFYLTAGRICSEHDGGGVNQTTLLEQRVVGHVVVGN